MTLLAITSPQGGTIITQDVSPGSANLAHPSPRGRLKTIQHRAPRVPPPKGLVFLMDLTQAPAPGLILFRPPGWGNQAFESLDVNYGLISLLWRLW